MRAHTSDDKTDHSTDFVGTAVADAAVIRDANLYELAGLDETEWSIVALELHANGRTSTMAVIVARKNDGMGVDAGELVPDSGAPLRLIRIPLSFPDTEPYRLLKVSASLESPAVRRWGGRIEIVEAQAAGG